MAYGYEPYMTNVSHVLLKDEYIFRFFEQITALVLVNNYKISFSGQRTISSKCHVS
jgi:hypothetical protein